MRSLEKNRLLHDHLKISDTTLTMFRTVPSQNNDHEFNNIFTSLLNGQDEHPSTGRRPSEFLQEDAGAVHSIHSSSHLNLRLHSLLVLANHIRQSTMDDVSDEFMRTTMKYRWNINGVRGGTIAGPNGAVRFNRSDPFS